MPTGPENERSRQHTFRIPIDLDGRIEQYALKQGIPRNRAVVDLLRRALNGEVHYRGTPSDSPMAEWDSGRDAPRVTPDVYERLEALEAALAAIQAPRIEPPQVMPKEPSEIDWTRFRLGKLCKKGHDWNDTGQSLRRNDKSGNCVECHRERGRQAIKTAKSIDEHGL